MIARAMALVVCGAWAAASLGCAGDGAAGRGASGAAPAGNPFPAVAVALHPLTRVVRDDRTGAVRVEAHLEVTDAFGHTVKDAMELRFELFRGAGPGDAAGSPELTWRLDLRDPRVNAAQFDPITRTYVVPLLDAPPWLAEGDRGELTVQATGTDGRRMASSRRLGG